MGVERLGIMGEGKVGFKAARTTSGIGGVNPNSETRIPESNPNDRMTE
jgi:hypothetical protein